MFQYGFLSSLVPIGYEHVLIAYLEITVEGVTKILRLRAENATVDAECNAITRDSSIRIIATFQKPFGNVSYRRKFARREFVTFASHHVLCLQSLPCLHTLVYIGEDKWCRCESTGYYSQGCPRATFE